MLVRLNLMFVRIFKDYYCSIRQQKFVSKRYVSLLYILCKVEKNKSIFIKILIIKLGIIPRVLVTSIDNSELSCIDNNNDNRKYLDILKKEKSC